MHKWWMRSVLKPGRLWITSSLHGCRTSSILNVIVGVLSDQQKRVALSFFPRMFRNHTLDCGGPESSSSSMQIDKSERTHRNIIQNHTGRLAEFLFWLCFLYLAVKESHGFASSALFSRSLNFVVITKQYVRNLPTNRF